MPLMTMVQAIQDALRVALPEDPRDAILGVHEVKRNPAVVGDRIVIRDLTNLSLSLDHRVVDGAVGADFFCAPIARLGPPEEWLTESDLA